MMYGMRGRAPAATVLSATDRRCPGNSANNNKIVYHAMTADKECGGKAPYIPNLKTRCR
jgi:hypothetical protein